jgi:uncharacterized delta-60 repeat protein
VALQADEKIIVAGQTGSAVNTATFVLRLNPDGSTDTSFNGTGGRIIDLPGFDSLSDVVVQPDGRIVVAGSAAADVLVERLLPNGLADPGFNGGQRLLIDFGGPDVGRPGAAARRQDRRRRFRGGGLRGRAHPARWRARHHVPLRRQADPRPRGRRRCPSGSRCRVTGASSSSDPQISMAPGHAAGRRHRRTRRQRHRPRPGGRRPHLRGAGPGPARRRRGRRPPAGRPGPRPAAGRARARLVPRRGRSRPRDLRAAPDPLAQRLQRVGAADPVAEEGRGEVDVAALGAVDQPLHVDQSLALDGGGLLGLPQP